MLLAHLRKPLPYSGLEYGGGNYKTGETWMGATAEPAADHALPLFLWTMALPARPSLHRTAKFHFPSTPHLPYVPIPPLFIAARWDQGLKGYIFNLPGIYSEALL